ncbi:MAG: glycoside hydrolase family 3 C-terminal domain-containing protein [Sedimentisphaerales bacterium]|jgi:beta-glucosidase
MRMQRRFSKQRSAFSVKCCVLIVICSSVVFAAYPFEDPNLPIEDRVNNIVSLMTLEEKISCLSTDPNVLRLGIKGSRHIEGLHGVALGGPGGWGRDNPVLTTQFPQAIGMAETWDTDIIKQAGEIEGYEARYTFQKLNRGALVVRAPNADLGRDPRWGRTEECYGEDPYFNGTLVVAFVKGLQGDNPKYWQTAALMKHFLANSNENGRGKSSSNFNERLLREYYSVPFRMGVVEGGSRAYMASYNAYNGIPCTVQPILKDITVKEWGQDGIICTDAGAYKNLVTRHRYYLEMDMAAAACIKAGINQFLDRYRDGVNDALKNKLLAEADIDNVIKGNYRVIIRLGLLDPPDNNPYAKIGRTDAQDPWLTDKHKQFARLITQKSIVLLKNTNNLLPLDKDKLKSVAVIGSRADEVLLDWYSGTPPYTVSPYEGIKNKLAGRATVQLAIDDTNNAAVNLAKQSDVVIVCVGNHPTCDANFGNCPNPGEGKEAVDRKSINLNQEELIKKVYRANPNTVVVLISSFPYAITWTQNNVPAIIHVTHNSQELGNALADVLFGDYNPAGRLVQTWPRFLDQLPPMMDYDIRDGRTYMYFKGEPLYPFGYGLSYTTFKYTNLRTSSDSISENGRITVSVDITNTGSLPGDEVVQMYVRHLGSEVQRPIKELKGFRRITLQPNETKTVQIPLKAESLAYWNTDTQRFVVERDKIHIMLGGSSAQTRVEKTVSVVGG